MSLIGEYPFNSGFNLKTIPSPACRANLLPLAMAAANKILSNFILITNNNFHGIFGYIDVGDGC